MDEQTRETAVVSDPPGEGPPSRPDGGRAGLRSRRRFMKGAAAAAGAAAASVAGTTAAKVNYANNDTIYGMLIDVRRCIGCHACAVACKAEFDVPLGQTRSWVEHIEKGFYPHVNRSFLPRLCNHCNHPPCVYVCPTGATYKRQEDGVVVVDTGICIGCKYCIQACPYDQRFLNAVTGTADKCDFCIHRISQGLIPACVEACLGGARIFGNINDPESDISQRLAANAVSVLREGQGTEPNVFYVAADHSDEHDVRHRGRYVRVTTHRKQKERR